MNDQIVSRESMFNRGAAAFQAGRSRDSHGMNPWAPALVDWQAGYDHAAQDCCAFFRAQAEVFTGVAAPELEPQVG